MEGVGVPISIETINCYENADRSKPGVQSGAQRFFDNHCTNGSTIPCTNIEINQKGNAIKGDEKKNIQQSNWLWMFCKQKINNFNLVTGLRATENN
jgi:hypothetical protein